jgi:hypothetical protein
MASVRSGMTEPHTSNPASSRTASGIGTIAASSSTFRNLLAHADLGGLLQAGVTGHEVGGGQRRQDRHAGLVGRHADLTEQGQRRRLVLEATEDVVGDDLGDERLDVGPAQDVVVGQGGYHSFCW